MNRILHTRTVICCARLHVRDEDIANRRSAIADFDPVGKGFHVNIFNGVVAGINDNACGIRRAGIVSSATTQAGDPVQSPRLCPEGYAIERVRIGGAAALPRHGDDIDISVWSGIDRARTNC